jgi:magnesium and cobalt transporter
MTKRSPHPNLWQRMLASLSHYLSIPWDRNHLTQLLRDAENRHIIDAQSLLMFEGILQVSELHVRDIMVPYSQMTVVNAEADLSEILPIVTESGHSRFPVIEDQNEVVGILLAKDLLAYQSEKEDFDIYGIMRPSIVVPESKRLNLMLQDFRRSHNHMAIVVDEYGKAIGLITIEDVLEQIVGEIEDEYDVDAEMLIKKHSETQFIVKAFTPIEDFNQYFGSDFSDEDFDTVGGLVTHALGHLPQRGEVVNIENFRFRILHADNRRIRLLRVTKI